MDFNFSDNEEEEDDLDLDAFDDTGLLALACRERDERPSMAAAVATAADAPPPAAAAAEKATAWEDGSNGEESDGGDWDNVDWEDADQEDEEGADKEGDSTQDVKNFPTQGVMINFGRTTGKSNDPDEGTDTKPDEDVKDEEEDKKPSAKKKKRKRVRVLKNVPRETKQMVLNVLRSEMLCNVVQCMQCSFACGGDISSIDDDEAEDDRMMLSHLALSMIPQEFHNTRNEPPTDGKSRTNPTKQQLQQFAQWFFQFVNHAGERRRNALERNAAQGAAVSTTRSSRRRGRRQSPKKQKMSETKNNGLVRGTSPPTQLSDINQIPTHLIKTLMYLSPQYDEDPQTFPEEEGIDAIDAVERISAQVKSLLFLVMARSLGWRARYAMALNPMPLELTVDHPLLAASRSAFKSEIQAASLDVKPPAKPNKFDQLHMLLRFVQEQGGELNNWSAGSGKRKGKKRKSSEASAKAASSETIDLVSSSGDEAKPSEKKVRPTKRLTASASQTQHAKSNEKVLLSWVEVLCLNEIDKKSMKSKANAMWVSILPEHETIDRPEEIESILAWMEANDAEKNKPNSPTKHEGKWGKATKIPCERDANSFAKKSPVSYVLAVEHARLKSNTLASNINRSQKGARLTDVTPRYANTWSRTLRLRGATGREITAGGGKCVDEWWESTLKQMNSHFKPNRKQAAEKSPVKSVTKTKTNAGKEVDLVELESSDEEKKKGMQPASSDSDDDEQIEAKPLTGNIEKEKIPTSKAAFKQSPFYVIPSVLNSQDVLHPDARKRICGVFKGELVYRRSDVSKALRAKKWLYQGRKVKKSEFGKPVKQVKARKKPVSKNFKALSSYGVTEEAQEEMISSMKKKSSEEEKTMDNLYGKWQTDPWSPPYVGPNDPIPTNEYKNVELALINPGLSHIDQVRLAPIARKLGIPYAPCMLGYEGHGGNRTANVRGIVVHDHNLALMQEAALEWESHTVEKEREERRNEILKRWKRLVVGILTKERLDREYG